MGYTCINNCHGVTGHGEHFYCPVCGNDIEVKNILCVKCSTYKICKRRQTDSTRGRYKTYYCPDGHEVED